MNRNTPEFNREEKTLQAMTSIYCRGIHNTETAPCADCHVLLDYALERLEKCPFGVDKPKCSHCKVHCYSTEMRDRIKEVMRYSGPRMLLEHPLLSMYHALGKRKD